MGFKRNDACLAKVDDDEPIFVLRAQDASAPSVVREWLHMNNQSFSIEKISGTWEIIDAMLQWQRDHPDRVKNPD